MQLRWCAAAEECCRLSWRHFYSGGLCRSSRNVHTCFLKDAVPAQERLVCLFAVRPRWMGMLVARSGTSHDSLHALGLRARSNKGQQPLVCGQVRIIHGFPRLTRRCHRCRRPVGIARKRRPWSFGTAMRYMSALDTSTALMPIDLLTEHDASQGRREQVGDFCGDTALAVLLW